MSETTFRPLRRGKQQLPPEEAIAILEQGSHGVLSVHGDDDYPYGVPLSYAYAAGKLYFHCAAEGHKLDALARCDKASFCVIAKDEVIAEEYTTYFRSVIAFGRLRVLDTAAEKRAALMLLAEKYSPALPSARHHRAIESELEHVCLLEFSIEHCSGKEARELMLQRQK